MISKAYQQKNPILCSGYLRSERKRQVSLYACRGRHEKADIEEGKEGMEIKLNIMQIYALFFSFF